MTENFQDLSKDSLCASLNFISIMDSAEYYYVLGQFVMYIFHSLGDLNKYKKEINHLSNPIVTQSMYLLAKRNLRFVENYPKLIKQKNSFIEIVYETILNQKDKFVTPFINEKLCSDAFYKGLYEDNFLVNCASIYNEF